MKELLTKLIRNPIVTAAVMAAVGAVLGLQYAPEPEEDAVTVEYRLDSIDSRLDQVVDELERFNRMHNP